MAVLISSTLDVQLWFHSESVKFLLTSTSLHFFSPAAKWEYILGKMVQIANWDQVSEYSFDYYNIIRRSYFILHWQTGRLPYESTFHITVVRAQMEILYR